MALLSLFARSRTRAATAEAERRSSPRYAVEMPVRFTRLSDRDPLPRQGLTCDVSEGGARFTTHDWIGLKAGDVLRLRLSGAQAMGRGGLLRTRHAEGVVVRVKPAMDPDLPTSVAVRFAPAAALAVHRWCA